MEARARYRGAGIQSSPRDAGRHDWACFVTQQAAEKAVEALVERAMVLDNFYVAARYPNGHPEGAPFEHDGPLQSEQAIAHAGEIIEFVSAAMA